MEWRRVWGEEGGGGDPVGVFTPAVPPPPSPLPRVLAARTSSEERPQAPTGRLQASKPASRPSRQAVALLSPRATHLPRLQQTATMSARGIFMSASERHREAGGSGGCDRPHPDPVENYCPHPNDYFLSTLLAISDMLSPSPLHALSLLLNIF